MEPWVLSALKRGPNTGDLGENSFGRLKKVFSCNKCLMSKREVANVE